MKQKLISLLAIMIPGAATMAQQNAGGDTWTLLSSDRNVSVYYEQGTCRNGQALFIRIVNNNNQPATVDWTLWDGTQAKKLEVKANETITGACENRLPMFTLTEIIPAGKSVSDMHPVIHVNVKP